MDRIHHPSAIATPPTVDAHATPGYPTEGDPIGGIEATIFTAWTGHALIEEIRNVIVAAGITPDKSDLTQLAAALGLFAAPRAQVFNTSGTFVVPELVARVGVLAWGGGGAGNTTSSGSYPGGGGGAGGFGFGIYTVTPGASIAVTRGAGGADAAGGASSFGSHLTAGGGARGGSGSSGVVGTGGAGGTVSGALFSVPGAPGSPGIHWADGAAVEGGMGMGSFGGQFVRAVGTGAANIAGNAGSFPGGGGTGGSGGSGSGQGTAGCVIVFS